MRLVLRTRHRLLLVLTGDDARDAVEDDDDPAVVDVSGGNFEPAPAPFGFYQPDEDDE